MKSVGRFRLIEYRRSKQSMSSKVTDDIRNLSEKILMIYPIEVLRSRRNLGRVSDKKDVLAKLSN